MKFLIVKDVRSNMIAKGNLFGKREYLEWKYLNVWLPVGVFLLVLISTKFIFIVQDSFVKFCLSGDLILYSSVLLGGLSVQLSKHTSLKAESVSEGVYGNQLRSLVYSILGYISFGILKVYSTSKESSTIPVSLGDTLLAIAIVFATISAIYYGFKIFQIKVMMSRN